MEILYDQIYFTLTFSHDRRVRGGPDSLRRNRERQGRLWQSRQSKRA